MELYSYLWYLFLCRLCFYLYKYILFVTFKRKLHVVFWFVTSCSLVGHSHHAYIFSVEEVFSEKLAPTYQTTQCNNRSLSL
jgi:hypothetical protein